VLALAVVLVLTPLVTAQTTSITSVQAPSTASLGSDVTVTVALTYDAGIGGMYLLASIYDADANTYANGTATSAQNTCGQNSGQFTYSAVCGYALPASSGSDVVTFHLRLDVAKTYNLGASAFLGDVNYKPISDSVSVQRFSITVYAPGTTPPSNSILETPNGSLSILGIALAIGGSIVIGQHFSKPRRNAPLPKTVLNGIGVLGLIGLILALPILFMGVMGTFFPVPGAAWGTSVGLQFLAVSIILIAAGTIMVKKGRRPYEPRLVFQKYEPSEDESHPCPHGVPVNKTCPKCDPTSPASVFEQMPPSAFEVVRRRVCPVHQFGMSYSASKQRYICPKCEANDGLTASNKEVPTTQDTPPIVPYETDEATRKELESKWREQYLKRERTKRA
jgi:hypothetical protein